MKLPDDIHQLLARRFRNNHRAWLGKTVGDTQANDQANDQWPLEIALGLPTEQAALRQTDGVRAWVAAWQRWQGTGTLVWCERQWRTIGLQRLPEKLILQGPLDVAQWIGEAARWQQATVRHQALVTRWPALAPHLARHFALLADYGDTDFQRLGAMLDWIIANPCSMLYPRQLPIAGLDSKWLDSRRALVADLVAAVQGSAANGGDFFRQCGLKALPQLIRLRILDSALRARVGGLGDISAPWPELAALDLAVTRVVIVENLQTGLAMPELPGTVVFMALGYHVDVLGRLPWVADKQCIYWGDLDTHGFAILNRVRGYLPGIASVLMDEETLRSHCLLWGEEKEQCIAGELAQLTAGEQAVYQGLRQQSWGQNVRLEQERVGWGYAMARLMGVLGGLSPEYSFCAAYFSEKEQARYCNTEGRHGNYPRTPENCKLDSRGVTK